MLEPWIIEQIRRREEEERRRDDRLQLEIPEMEPLPSHNDAQERPVVPVPSEPQRGVVIISF